MAKMLMGNGAVDIATALDPTGLVEGFWSTSLFKGIPDGVEKVRVMGEIRRGFLLHGLIRLYTGIFVDDKQLRRVAILSYMCEMVTSLYSFSNGTMSTPDVVPFVVIPVLMIAQLVKYQYKPKQ